jgi:hypothetical protein
MGKYKMRDNRGYSLTTKEEIKIINEMCNPTPEEWNELNEWVKDKNESFYTNPYDFMDENLNIMNFIDAKRFYLLMIEDNNGK